MTVEIPQHIQNRMKKIEDWLVWEQERYEELLSRSESAQAPSGFAEPRCEECKRVTKSCKTCDRPKSVLDPYALDVPQVKGGWSVQSANDESLAQKRSAGLAKIDQALLAIERDVAIREGREAVPDASMRLFIAAQHVPHTLRKIQHAIAKLDPSLRDRLPHGQAALFTLACTVSGSVDPIRAGSIESAT